MKHYTFETNGNDGDKLVFEPSAAGVFMCYLEVSEGSDWSPSGPFVKDGTGARHGGGSVFYMDPERGDKLYVQAGGNGPTQTLAFTLSLARLGDELSDD